MKKQQNNRNSQKIISKRSNSDIRHGRHCVFMMHVHLVFVTKYRNFVLSSRVLDLLENTFRTVCEKFEADLVEFEGERDHVHLLVNYPPKVQISKLVNSLKGVSLRKVRLANFKEVRKNSGVGVYGVPVILRGVAEELVWMLLRSIYNLKIVQISFRLYPRPKVTRFCRLNTR